MFSILTRTSNRPKAFARCRDSVLVQTEPAFHIVSTDNDLDAYPKGGTVIRVPYQPGRGHNLYFNQMRRCAPPQSPWLIFLDDDDTFTAPDALSAIRAHIRSENDLILWKVNIGGRIIPDLVPKVPHRPGDVAGIGFCVHVKNWIDWPGTPAADFAVIRQYYERLNPVWIDRVLTAAQRTAGQGKRLDF